MKGKELIALFLLMALTLLLAAGARSRAGRETLKTLPTERLTRPFPP